ncbi:MAG: hypothetical protein ABJ308_06790 [Halieaceae bacterium]
MQSRINCVSEAAGEMLQSFIVMAMKTMFRRGASGGQIRNFLGLYLPEQNTIYQGDQVLTALQELQRAGTVERRGIHWCLATL